MTLGKMRADEVSQIEVGGGVLDVTIAASPAGSNGAAFDLSQNAMLSWVRDAANAVTWYFGKYPVPRAKITIRMGRRDGVTNGTTFGEGGARTRIFVGQHTTVDDLKEDWMMTHEMVHYGFPSVEDDHHWIEEGSAVYIEPVARVHTGQLRAERIWADMVRDMPQGLPKEGDQGLNNTHTWGRTYWGGAIFCLLADVEIRKQTKNQKGIRDAFRAINQAGGTVDVDWPLQRAFELGDKATGTKVLMNLWAQQGPKPVNVDLADLWKQLGVRIEGSTIAFDAKAPLASVRAAIA